MVIDVSLSNRVLALQDSVSLARLVGSLLGSSELLCKGSTKFATRIRIQEKDSAGQFGELTGHVAVDELELVKPPGAPGLECGQLRFGSLPLGIVLIAFGFELLVLKGALL